MPFTLLAHQAPVLPLIEHGGRRWDGVALVAGSVAPDLFEVTRGWGAPTDRHELWFDGHSVVNFPVVVAIAVILTAILRKWVLPVGAALRPNGPAVWNLRRAVGPPHRWTVVVCSASVGVASHLALDALTHADSSPFVAWGWLGASDLHLWGWSIGVTAVLQTIVSAVLAVYAAWTVRRMCRARPEPVVTDQEVMVSLPHWAHLAFWAWAVATVCAACAFAMTRTGYHVSSRGVLPLVMKPNVVSGFLGVGLIGLIAGCAALCPFLVRGAPQGRGR